MLKLKNIFKTRNQAVSLIFIIIVSVILLIQSYGKAYRDSGYDFTSYIYSSKLLSEQQNPYDNSKNVQAHLDYPKPSFPYIYPLTFAFIMTPFNYFPYYLSISIWFFAGLICLMHTIKILLISAETENEYFRVKPEFTIVSALLMLFLFNITQNNFLNGQLNFILLYLVTLSYYMDTKGKIFLPALTLAFAVSIKLTPVIFLIYFLVNKKYKLVIYSIIMTVILLFIPYVLIGDKIISFYNYYLSNFLFNPEENLNFILNTFGNVYLSPVTVLILLLILILVNLLYQKYKTGFIQLHLFSFYCVFLLLLTPKLQTHTLIFVLPAFEMIILLILYIHRKFNLRYLYILLAALLIILYISKPLDMFNLLYFFILILLITIVLNINNIRKYFILH